MCNKIKIDVAAQMDKYGAMSDTKTISFVDVIVTNKRTNDVINNTNEKKIRFAGCVNLELLKKYVIHATYNGNNACNTS